MVATDRLVSCLDYSWLFPSRSIEVADQSDLSGDPTHTKTLYMAQCESPTVNARCSLHNDLPQDSTLYTLIGSLQFLLYSKLQPLKSVVSPHPSHASCRIRCFGPRLPARPTLFLSFSSLQNFIVTRSILYLRYLFPAWTCIASLVYCPCVRDTHASDIQPFSSLAFFRSEIWPLNHVVKNKGCPLCTRRS